MGDFRGFSAQDTVWFTKIERDLGKECVNVFLDVYVGRGWGDYVVNVSVVCCWRGVNLFQPMGCRVLKGVIAGVLRVKSFRVELCANHVKVVQYRKDLGFILEVLDRCGCGTSGYDAEGCVLNFF